MATGETDIYVYADWKGLAEPQLMGILSAHAAKGRKAFGFEYNKDRSIKIRSNYGEGLFLI